MINYYFDNTNEMRPYTHQLDANDDTLAPDNALRIEPKFKDGFHPCENNGEWVLVEDHRGENAYSIETQESSKVDYLGTIKAGFTLLEPFQFSKWNGKEWVLDIDAKNTHTIQQNTALRDSLLNAANAEIEILSRAVRLRRATDADKSRLELLENYTIDLYELDLSSPDVVIPEKP